MATRLVLNLHENDDQCEERKGFHKGETEGQQQQDAGAGFELLEKDVLAVIGPNGAGKSTLLRLISGFLEPSAGSAELLGRDVRSYSKVGLARLVAYVPSELYLPYDFSVLEIALMGRSPRVPWWRDYSDADVSRVLGYLKEVGILELRDRSINSLSSGERQLALIAQALAQEPRVLLLDEPTASLDFKASEKIENLLSELKRDYTIVAVSHSIGQARRIADNILVMKEGKIVTALGAPQFQARGSLEDLLNEVF